MTLHLKLPHRVTIGGDGSRKSGEIAPVSTFFINCTFLQSGDEFIANTELVQIQEPALKTRLVLHRLYRQMANIISLF